MSLSWYIRADYSAARQSNLSCFSLTRVGLFGLGDADFEADTFGCGSVVHSWGLGATLFLGWTAAGADLVEGGESRRCGCEGARLKLVREESATGCVGFELRSRIDERAQSAQSDWRW